MSDNAHTPLRIKSGSPTPASHFFPWKGLSMLVNWKKDVDAALSEAKSQNKPLLIDFSAAPA
jgi:hypothetical protein